ncbi:unnamed protein product, partial [Rotaria magnacalcarata]
MATYSAPSTIILLPSRSSVVNVCDKRFQIV